ncbi:hypothetical protein QTP70_009531 [Hemibagrus guttatus]|uniref:Uncharacterized protein n=1 Tax=Hemibagrus guttatus TaxID=175788 RepID=A0AAE0PU15_9TELE|nr:hypothetical protein QTP70_009531 [Hemibagrus guttatus]
MCTETMEEFRYRSDSLSPATKCISIGHVVHYVGCTSRCFTPYTVHFARLAKRSTPDYTFPGEVYTQNLSRSALKITS